MKTSICLGILMLLACTAAAPTPRAMLVPASLVLDVGEAKKLELKNGAAGAKFESGDSKVAIVHSNGWVIGLSPGQTAINAGGASCKVRVVDSQERMVSAATIQQYPDNRTFKVGQRKCVGTFLNGHMVGNEQNPVVDRNRVLNPRPLRDDRPLEWELVEGTPVYDGAGVLMGTTGADLKVGERMVTTTKFNYGFSKIINGRVCLYGFNIDIRPGNAAKQLMDASQRKKQIVSTSAWVVVDGVVEKETILDHVGLGKGKLPRLVLDSKRFRITGGDPDAYMTDKGELRIVKDPDGDPVPSHYLRRPTGTVNIIYCVPGFSLGGQSLDSLLVSSGAIFRPARGVRAFAQPTFYPSGHPRAGEKSDKTMTFIYGAVEAKGTETIYGWVAQEAMEPIGAK